MTEQETVLFRAMIPWMARETTRINEQNVPFAHYTTAESAIKILRGGEIWLRNSRVMNDFSEVKHGMSCLRAAWTGAHGKRLQKLMADVEANLPDQFKSDFDDKIEDVLDETYLFSISEHGDTMEYKHGRLSMWRAYAPRNGVAFVFNNTPFIAKSDALKAYACPVNYATEAKFVDQFESIVDSLETNLEIMKNLGGAWVRNALVRAFTFIIQSTKHISFNEEKEWRVIYAPKLLYRDDQLSDQQLARIPTEIVTLAGVPQRIFKIPFQDYLSEGLTGATIPELIKHVLIGPATDSYMIAHAIEGELIEAGVKDAAQKIIITDIPIRI